MFPPLDFYRLLPKVDLHRHLEGSLRLETMVEIARIYGITIPLALLGPMVQVQKGDPLTFKNFLSKFTTLRLFYRSPEIIARITREAIEDAAKDGIHYLELRFTPVALSRVQSFPLRDVIDWVTESAQKAAKALGIWVGLIVSANRHEPVSLAEQAFRLAAEYRQRGVVGVDIAGNEAEFPLTPFIPLLHEAHQAGLRVTVHAGEWSGAESVHQAIEAGAERIGHGVRVVENENTVALARERGVTFEVCITSNYQSGVVSSLEKHPFPHMRKKGLNVTINTDDPAVSQITLSGEYHLVSKLFSLAPEEIFAHVLLAARASFLPTPARQELEKRLRAKVQF